MSDPLIKKTHQAAVKALAWSPKHQNLLVSGSGTADWKLRLWDVSKKELIEEIDTGSQICSVVFSPH